MAHGRAGLLVMESAQATPADFGRRKYRRVVTIGTPFNGSLLATYFKELNERFGQWFYVISGDNLAALQVKREDLVKAKESDSGEAQEGDLPPRPDINFDPTDSGGARQSTGGQSD